MVGSLFGDRPVTVTGYRSPESGQSEVSAFHEITALNEWETIHTVTTGKTFYLTNVIFANRDANVGAVKLGVGEVTYFEFWAAATSNTTFEFSIPMPFTSAQAIQVYSGIADHACSITLIGFEE